MVESDVRTFGYSQGRFWSMVTIGSSVLFSASGLLDWRMQMRGDLIFEDVCAALTVFLGVFVLKLPPLCRAAGIVALDTRRRRAERITTDREGITFDDGRRHVAATWDEVTGHFIQASPQSADMRGAALSTSLGRAGRWVIVVETERGCFQYSLFIEGAGQLCRTIGERAVPVQRRSSVEEAASITSPRTCQPSSGSGP